jgi:hypothetical protein
MSTRRCTEKSTNVFSFTKTTLPKGWLMPVVKKTKLNWVSGAEALALLDRRARRVLNMSGEEFIEKWESGHFKNMDSGDCPGVIGVALLAPTGTSRGRKNKKRRKG